MIDQHFRAGALAPHLLSHAARPPALRRAWVAPGGANASGVPLPPVPGPLPEAPPPAVDLPPNGPAVPPEVPPSPPAPAGPPPPLRA